MLAVLKFLFALNQDLGQILSNLDLEPTLRLKYDRVLFEQFDAAKKKKLVKNFVKLQLITKTS